MPANRRLKRLKKDVSDADAFFAIALQGKTKQIETSELEAVIEIALTEAYGCIGGAHFQWSVHSAKKVDNEIQAVLNVPCKEDRGRFWTALTMFHSLNDKPVHISVSANADTVEGLNLVD